DGPRAMADARLARFDGRLGHVVEVEVDGAVDDRGDAVLPQQLQVAGAVRAADEDVDTIGLDALDDAADDGALVARRLRLHKGLLMHFFYTAARSGGTAPAAPRGRSSGMPVAALIRWASAGVAASTGPPPRKPPASRKGATTPPASSTSSSPARQSHGCMCSSA